MGGGVHRSSLSRILERANPDILPPPDRRTTQRILHRHRSPLTPDERHERHVSLRLTCVTTVFAIFPRGTDAEAFPKERASGWAFRRSLRRFFVGRQSEIGVVIDATFRVVTVFRGSVDNIPSTVLVRMIIGIGKTRSDAVASD